MVADHQRNSLIIGQHCFYLRICLVKSNVLVDRIEYLHEILVVTLLILLVLLLEGDDNEIIVFELSDDLLLTFHWVCLDFLPASVLVNVLGIAFEADKDVPRSAYLH